VYPAEARLWEDQDAHAGTSAQRATRVSRRDRTGARPDRPWLVGDWLTLADICFATEVALFSAERAHAKVLAEAGLEPLWSDALRGAHPRALAHFDRLCAHPAFAPDLGSYLAKLSLR
jgi:glutathione S-transferase